MDVLTARRGSACLLPLHVSTVEAAQVTHSPAAQPHSRYARWARPGASVFAIILIAVALLAGCASAPISIEAARSELAPNGKLRVGLLVTNQSYVTRDGNADEIRGVGVDIGRELAKQLGVAFEPVRYKNIPQLLNGAKTGQWDVAFLGFDPERTADMDFAAPYAEVGQGYMVHTKSSIRAVDDADRPGHRIAAQERSVQHAYVRQQVKRAEVIAVASTSAGVDLLTSGKAHAYPGPLSSLTAWTAKRPDLRVADGTLFTIAQWLAVAKGRPQGTAYARAFIEHAKTSGLVQQAIERSAMTGMKVAPAGVRN
jgi:polar amino acid transport system substrate-binding protein